LLYSRQKIACIKLFFSATGLIASIIDRLVEDKDYCYNRGEEHNIYSVVIISKKKTTQETVCLFPVAVFHFVGVLSKRHYVLFSTQDA